MHLARHEQHSLNLMDYSFDSKKSILIPKLSNSFKFIYNTISSNKRCVVCSKSSHNPDEVSKFEWQNCEEQSTNGNAMEYQIVPLVRLIFRHVPLSRCLLNAVVLHQII
jgi:hypothetical protein